MNQLKTQRKVMKTSIKILSIILITLLISCGKSHKIYKTTDKKGYCYYDDGLWYIYYFNTYTNQYYFYGMQTTYTTYDNASPVSWTPTVETVSNYNEIPSETELNVEANGQDVGGSDEMSESSGSDSGGSDSSGGDSGGGE